MAGHPPPIIAQNSLSYAYSLDLCSTAGCHRESTGSSEATESAQITRELRPHWAAYRTLLLSGDLSRMMRIIVAGMGAISL